MECVIIFYDGISKYDGTGWEWDGGMMGWRFWEDFVRMIVMNDIMMNSYNGTMRRWNGRKGLGQFFFF